MDTRRADWPSSVLVIDAYPDSAESMALVLKVWGYLPLVAFDGIMGLKLALTHRPDVIFLEISLPGMDGHEVARRIRAEPGMEKTPLLALTNSGRACDKEASLGAGFDRHLVKPVDPEKLRRLLAELVAGLNEEDCRGGASSRGEEHRQVSRAHFPGARGAPSRQRSRC